MSKATEAEKKFIQTTSGHISQLDRTLFFFISLLAAYLLVIREKKRRKAFLEKLCSFTVIAQGKSQRFGEKIKRHEKKKGDLVECLSLYTRT